MKPDSEYNRPYRSQRKQRIYRRVVLLLFTLTGGTIALAVTYLALKR